MCKTKHFLYLKKMYLNVKSVISVAGNFMFVYIYIIITYC